MSLDGIYYRMQTMKFSFILALFSLFLFSLFLSLYLFHSDSHSLPVRTVVLRITHINTCTTIWKIRFFFYSNCSCYHKSQFFFLYENYLWEFCCQFCKQNRPTRTCWIIEKSFRNCLCYIYENMYVEKKNHVWI